MFPRPHAHLAHRLADRVQPRRRDINRPAMSYRKRGLTAHLWLALPMTIIAEVIGHEGFGDAGEAAT